MHTSTRQHLKCQKFITYDQNKIMHTVLLVLQAMFICLMLKSSVSRSDSKAIHAGAYRQSLTRAEPARLELDVSVARGTADIRHDRAALMAEIYPGRCPAERSVGMAAVRYSTRKPSSGDKEVGQCWDSD